MVGSVSGGARPLLCLGPASGTSCKIDPTSVRPTVYGKPLKKPFKPETLSRGFCGSLIVS